MHRSSPPILSLPVELLHSILSLVVPFIKHDQLYKLQYLQLKESPFHAVRSTCRIFRWIVDDFPFWRNDTFKLPFTLNPEYLEVLISDPHLQQCLAQKTGWRAYSLHIVQILARHIPQFGRGVHYLQLDNKYTSKPWHSIPETLCSAFPVLTVLELSSDTHVHLDILPRTLRRLELDAPLDKSCYCFNTLPNLEQFSFHHRSRQSLHLKKLLPFNSKHSLREFQFSFPPVCYLPSKHGAAIPDFALLHQFENLTTLRTRGRWVPHNLCVYRSLLQSPFRLKTFETDVPQLNCDPDLIPTLTALLRSPVLHDLQSLQISFCGYTRIDIEKQHIYEPFIKAIGDLPFLEELTLLRFLLHQNWLQHFQNSQRLKYVKWDSSSFRTLDPFGEFKVEDWANDLANILSQFQSKPPRVEISCWN
jgi:hypothetical protein